jgi:GntR family transcriptional regulator
VKAKVAGTVGNSLARILRNRISSLQYKGSLPTELELIREFGASRYAVRSALERLVSDGVIQRTAGRGTVILAQPTTNPPWVTRTIEDLIERNIQTKNRLIKAAPVAASSYRKVAAVFMLSPDTKLFIVERLAVTETGAPIFYSCSFMRLELALTLPRKLIADRPLILLIEKSRRVRAHRVQQVTSIQQATPKIAKQLEMPPPLFGEVVRVSRTYFDRDGEAMVHGELFYRLDRFEQTIEFSRDSSG